MDGDDLEEMLAREAVYPHELAQWCGVDRRTVKRWLGGRAPVYVVSVIRYKCGYLSDERWSDWQVRKGKLFGPFARYYWWPGDILALLLQRQSFGAQRALVAKLRVELAEAKAVNERLRDKLPAAEVIPLFGKTPGD